MHSLLVLILMAAVQDKPPAPATPDKPAVEKPAAPPTETPIFKTLIKSVSLDGQIRVRAEYKDPTSYLNTDAATRSDDLFLTRIRLNLKFSVNDDIDVFVQPQDQRAWGQEASVLTDERNLDLHQGFVEVRNLFSEPLTFKAGRMEMSYGDQRLISPLDWSNIGRAWDGAKLRYAPKDWWIEGFYTVNIAAIKCRKRHWKIADAPGVVLTDHFRKSRVSASQAPQPDALDVDLDVSGSDVNDGRRKSRGFRQSGLVDSDGGSESRLGGEGLPAPNMCFYELLALLLCLRPDSPGNTLICPVEFAAPIIYVKSVNASVTDRKSVSVPVTVRGLNPWRQGSAPSERQCMELPEDFQGPIFALPIQELAEALQPFRSLCRVGVGWLKHGAELAYESRSLGFQESREDCTRTGGKLYGRGCLLHVLRLFRHRRKGSLLG